MFRNLLGNSLGTVIKFLETEFICHGIIGNPIP